MSDTASLTSSTVSYRALAFPVERGGWGVLLEPVFSGLLLAPSPAGVAIAVAALAGFLSRHPARLALHDWKRRAIHPRTGAAARVASLYAFVTAVGLSIALLISRGRLASVLALAAPAAVVYLAYDLRLRSRELVAELSGALSLSATAPAIAVASGWPPEQAFGLWLLVGGRAVTSVLEVRTRVRRLHGIAVSSAPALLAHAVAILAALWAGTGGLAPMLAVLVPTALAVRSVANLCAPGNVIPARAIGWAEVFTGVAVVLAWTVAYGASGTIS